MTVSAPHLVAQTELVHFLGNRRADRGVADIRVDFDAQVPADNHRFALRVVDVGRQDGAPSGQLLAGPARGRGSPSQRQSASPGLRGRGGRSAFASRSCPAGRDEAAEWQAKPAAPPTIGAGEQPAHRPSAGAPGPPPRWYPRALLSIASRSAGRPVGGPSGEGPLVS